MKFYIIVLMVLTSFSSIHANDSFNSEMSHFIGGGVMAGGVTATISRYYPEYREERGTIGFGVSSAAIIAFESVTVALSGNAKGQLLDIVSHISGSVLGAFLTDQCILSPVVSSSLTEGKYLGLAFQKSF